MAIKLINQYQAWWDSSANRGYFWFTGMEHLVRSEGN